MLTISAIPAKKARCLMIAHRFWTIRSLSICLALACFSGLSAHAEPRMGLVAPGVGWALQNQSTGQAKDDHLFWTNDDGADWRDITPQDRASRQIAGVFFLDASRGWGTRGVIAPSSGSGVR